MSKYTTEVRYYCETIAGKSSSEGYNSINNILDTCVNPQNSNRVFNFSYPMFDPAYKPVLEKKILRHYYTREISEETVGLWKLRLEDRMNMIMPYYNKLYESELIKFDPMKEVDITTVSNRANDGTTSLAENRTSDQTANIKETENIENNRNITDETQTNTSRNTEVSQVNSGESTETGSNANTTTSNGTNNNVSWQLYSDTPQGGITGVNGFPVETPAGETPVSPEPLIQYLTSAQKNTSDTVTADTEVSNGTDSTVQTSDTTSESKSTDAYNETENANRNDNFSEDRANNRESTAATNETRTANNVISNTEDYIEHIIGKNSATSYSRLLNEYRKTFINIDQMIVDELQDLFFGLW